MEVDRLLQLVRTEEDSYVRGLRAALTEARRVYRSQTNPHAKTGAGRVVRAIEGLLEGGEGS